MERWDFVDLATKAKKLGITEGTLRARLMSGNEYCFIYAADFMSWAADNSWLPAHDAERFPMVRWIDHGSEFCAVTGFDSTRRFPPNRTPRYQVTGWVAIPPHMAAEVLTLGYSALDFAHVAVFDCNSILVSELQLHVQGRTEWVTTDSSEYIEGGWERGIPATVKPADLFMPTGAGIESNMLSSRKEQSYLSIIAAMRALLRDEDGGGFPSEAKIIDQLVTLFPNIDGVSKRKLESVFAGATRTTGDLRVRRSSAAR